jgi:hypothetical protein
MPLLCVGLAACSSSSQSVSPPSDASVGDSANATDAGPTDAAPSDAPGPSDASGWQLAYSAPSTDADGGLMEGTEVRALVPFNGSLYAGIGYWEDTQGFASTTPNPNLPGAQVLRLDAPDADWQIELEIDDLGDAGKFDVYAIAALEAVTVTTDSTGAPLPAPGVAVLAATTWTYSPGLHIYTRTASNPAWSKSTVGVSTGTNEGRAFASHTDAVTGVSGIFFGSDYGIYRGTYDSATRTVVWPDAPEAWGTAPDGGSETPPLDAGWRVMAFADCGGRIYASVGPSIYQRQDGPSPTWTTVFTYPFVNPTQKFLSGTGGLRGLYCFENGGSPVLMTAVEGPKASILRIDPSHGFQSTVDEDVVGLLDQKLQFDVGGCLLAYNHFTPVTDPATNERALLIGFETSLKPSTPAGTPIFDAGNGEFLATAHYMVRHADGGYDVLTVPDPLPTPLVSVRTMAVSPFSADEGGVVYAGGFDCNGTPVHDTAWAMKAPVATALGRP